jgi:DNA adenine methylase
MKTCIRWAGSKKALLPHLRRYCSEIKCRYIEPFCGSACLFFDVEPREAILGDINSELITTYRAIKLDTSNVIECLKRSHISESNYYALRNLDTSLLSDVEIAARFLFLNRLCFNGIYRTNRQGRFNVPYAHPKSKVKFEWDAIFQMAELLDRASLRNEDFETVLQEAEKGDFVYLDPPYAISKRRVFTEYHGHYILEESI